MKSWIVFTICVSLLSLSGCGGATRGKTPQEPPTMTIAGPQAVATRNGVKLTLALDRPVYQPGDLVWAEAVLENTGSEPVMWFASNPCRGPVTISGHLPGSTEAWDSLASFTAEETVRLQQKGQQPEPHPCPAVMVEHQLQPGATVRVRAAWDQKAGQPSEQVPAPPGRFSVAAVFTMGSLKAEDPLTVKTEGELGSQRPKLISRGAALGAAKADPQVAAWIQNHSGDPRYPADGGAVYRGGKWVVHFGQKLGPAPHQLDAAVDAATGRVESVTFLDN